MQLEGFTRVGALESGVYALVWRREVVYVGKSSNVLRRVYQHRNNRLKVFHRDPGWTKIKAIPFDDIWVMDVPYGRLDAVEAEMIARYRPRFNDRLVPKVDLPKMHINGVTIGGGPQRPLLHIERRV
jgi:excinuclease UvrABC nuclease subunit